MKKIKVIHIAYSDYIGGASRAALRIHKSLLKSNEVYSDLYVINKSLEKNTNVHKIEKNNIIYLFKLLFNKVINKFFIGKMSILSLNIFSSLKGNFLNNLDFDVVHLHWINNETISIKEISKIKKKIIWTCHDMWPFLGAYHYMDKTNKYGINFIDKIILNLKKKYLLNKKINFVGVSSWVKGEINKSIFQNNNSYFINNPIDENLWKISNFNEFRKDHNLNFNDFLIGIGNLEENLTERKGINELESALETLKNKNFKFKLIEFGNEKNSSFFKKFETISFGKILSDKLLLKIYNNLDVFLLPSKLEAFGQVATEAIFCGTPVVGFSNTGLNDIIIHKKNGWLADNFSPLQLAKGIEFIYDSKLDRNSVRNTIIKKFSYESISQQYISVYKKSLHDKV